MRPSLVVVVLLLCCGLAIGLGLSSRAKGLAGEREGPRWPPHPESIVNIGGSQSLAAGQEVSIHQVPGDRWLVVTSVKTWSNAYGVELIEDNGGARTNKLEEWFTNPEVTSTKVYDFEPGLLFAPGSTLLFRSPRGAVLSFNLVGYVVPL